MSWQQVASPIIMRVIAECGTADMNLLRRKLRQAYPFGERKYHPYKIWCDEVRSQLGLKRVGANRRKPGAGELFQCPEQLGLFSQQGEAPA
jgi:hypothetical protein